MFMRRSSSATSLTRSLWSESRIARAKKASLSMALSGSTPLADVAFSAIKSKSVDTHSSRSSGVLQIRSRVENEAP